MMRATKRMMTEEKGCGWSAVNESSDDDLKLLLLLWFEN